MPVFNVDTSIEIRWGKSTFSDYRSVHNARYRSGTLLVENSSASGRSPVFAHRIQCKHSGSSGGWDRLHELFEPSTSAGDRLRKRRLQPLPAFAYIGLPRLILDLTERRRRDFYSCSLLRIQDLNAAGSGLNDHSAVRADPCLFAAQNLIESPPIRWIVNGCQSLAFNNSLIRSFIDNG